jgi:Flp pilus assembly pilin Flp
VQNIVEKYVSETETAGADDDGVVAIEYVVVAAAIVVALAALFTAFGADLDTKLQAVVNKLPG